MSGKSTAAFGIFSDRQSVEDALISLRNEGFRSTDISVLFPDNVGTRNFAHEKKTQAPAGATAGGGTGMVLGGALGWLTGIGPLTIPGMGPFLASGPIVAALAGAGVGGALGGIMGALIGFGVPEYEAKRYEGRVAKGGYSCPSTVMIPNGHARRSRFSMRMAPRIFRRLAMQRRMSRIRVGPCLGRTRLPEQRGHRTLPGKRD